MSKKSNITHPLPRKGTSQVERYPLALQKDYVKLDERSFHDFIRQSAELSKYFQYFENHTDKPDATWKVFFTQIYDFDTKQVKTKELEELESNSSMVPHLALFLSFLKLFQLSIDQLNGLGEKHLLFFYKEMLRMEPRNAISPQVTLMGELAKDVHQLMIPEGTLFKAGKNKLGAEILYRTDEDVILNQAKIVALKTINFLGDIIRYRTISNSADGKGAELQQDPKSWSGFGKDTDSSCEIGFCIASPFFNINEGTRKLSLQINVDLNDFDVL